MQDITQITLKSESDYDFCPFTPYKNQTEKYPDQLYITKCIQHEPTAPLKLQPQALAYYFAVRKIIQNNIKNSSNHGPNHTQPTCRFFPCFSSSISDLNICSVSSYFCFIFCISSWCLILCMHDWNINRHLKAKTNQTPYTKGELTSSADCGFFNAPIKNCFLTG